MQFQEFNLSKNADGLLPVIIQDADSLKVLMLGYMNQEAFEKSQAERRVTFYSRSRQTQRRDQRQLSAHRRYVYGLRWRHAPHHGPPRRSHLPSRHRSLF